MEKRKSRYTPLPGVMHGGEKSPLKHHNYTNYSDQIREGHSHGREGGLARPGKSPINMVNPASTTMMNPTNPPLAMGPLMKKLSKKQQYIAKQAGDPNKIEGSDFAALKNK